MIVPPQCFSIVERLGRFHKVLTPGVHLLVALIDHQKFVKWSYRNQENRLKVTSGYVVFGENCQLDVPPVKCRTKDELQVSVDITIMYEIKDFYDP